MKRKVIQLAGNTLVVSLPKKWTERQGVTKGIEVDVEEKGSSLLITTETKSEIQKTEVNLKDVHPRTVVHTLIALHHRGFDEITILFNQESTLETVHNLLRDAFLGFMIVKQDAHKISIRSIATYNPEEFETTLRRAFLVMLSLADSTLQVIKEGKFKRLEPLLANEKINNQLALFCQRVIAKHGVAKDRDQYLHLIASVLNKITDGYRDIIIYLSKEKHQGISQPVISFFEKVNAYVHQYYECYYKFTEREVNALCMQRDQLLSEGNKLLESAKKEDVIVTMYLLDVTRKNGSIITSMIAVKS